MNANRRVSRHLGRLVRAMREPAPALECMVFVDREVGVPDAIFDRDLARLVVASTQGIAACADAFVEAEGVRCLIEGRR